MMDMYECLQDVLKPFLAACGIRSPKLASISLTSIQKLLARGLLDNEDILAIMQALEQVLTEPGQRQAKQPLASRRVVHRHAFVFPDVHEKVSTGLLSQVEKLRDEGVQLKMLQTGLALMQSPLLADNEVCSFLI